MCQFCGLQFTVVQRPFCVLYKKPPKLLTVFTAAPNGWGEKCAYVKGISTEWPIVSEVANRIAITISKIPRKTYSELGIPQPLVWHILHKLLKMNLGPLHLMKTLIKASESK